MFLNQIVRFAVDSMVLQSICFIIAAIQRVFYLATKIIEIDI